MKLLDYELLNFLLLLYDAIFISFELKVFIKIFLIWDYSLGENKTNILDFFLGKVLFSLPLLFPIFLFLLLATFCRYEKSNIFFLHLEIFFLSLEEILILL